MLFDTLIKIADDKPNIKNVLNVNNCNVNNNINKIIAIVKVKNIDIAYAQSLLTKTNIVIASIQAKEM